MRDNRPKRYLRAMITESVRRCNKKLNKKKNEKKKKGKEMR